MKNQILNYCFSSAVFQALVYFLVIKINYSVPINSSLTYDNFLKEIQHDNCMFPKQILLPFNSSDTFEYLGVHIKICTSGEKKSKRTREAIALCSDIFDNLKNITCHPDKNVQLPEIKVEFSQKVCDDISSLKFISENETFLKHLNDKFVCDLMCDDEFNPACQVLLWSYQVQQQINSVVVEPKKTELEAVDNNNLETANQESVQNEDVTVNANKDNLNSGNVDKSQMEVPSNKNNVNSGNVDKSQMDLPSNKTTPIEKSVNNADVVTISHTDKDKDENANIPAKPSSVNVNENQEKIDLPNKEKDVKQKQQISTVGDNINSDKVNENFVNVDEPPVKSNVIPSDNLKETAIITKTKQSDAKDNKLVVPEKAGLVEAVSKSQSKSLDTATKSIKDETKLKSETVANVETSSVGKTPSETKDSKVMLEKTKDTKISTLNTEEAKIGGAVEIVKQNTVSESFTGETNNIEDISPVTTAADLEKMEDGNEIPEPSDKNQEPYNDMENEGDYSKLDYDDADDGFYDSSKNKKTDLVEESKMPVVESQNELPKYDVYQPRNSIGRGVEDIQVIPAFPEQEDSHFFFYFLSIVLILMGGYLVFHNKQKIIALIVEGRHERRRRSHGVGYKKLETK